MNQLLQEASRDRVSVHGLWGPAEIRPSRSRLAGWSLAPLLVVATLPRQSTAAISLQLGETGTTYVNKAVGTPQTMMINMIAQTRPGRTSR